MTETDVKAREAVLRAKVGMYENWLREHLPDCPLLPENIVVTDSAVPTETFVLERVENPHPDMLADALLIRANARAAVERLGELADYDVDWRIAWKFTVRGMAKATGCTTEELEAWMDRMEAQK